MSQAEGTTCSQRPQGEKQGQAVQADQCPVTSGTATAALPLPSPSGSPLRAQVLK